MIASSDDIEEQIYGSRHPPDGLVQPVLDALGRLPKKKGQFMPVPRGGVNLLGKPKEGERVVTLMKDTNLEFPQMYLKIYLQPDTADPREASKFAQMFIRSGCTLARHLDEADLVVFGGGSDVEPKLYGAEPHPLSRWSEDRDNDDIGLYLQCYDAGIPMLGICRGAQFLHVMNGGKLYQHVDNHVGDHRMLDLKTKVIIEKVSSVHHQSVMPNVANGMEILATTAKSSIRWIDAKNKKIGAHPDIEAFWYPETVCIGIQGHPEYAGYHKFAQWTLELIQELVIMNPDIDWGPKNVENLLQRRRIKPDLVAQRNEKVRLQCPIPHSVSTPKEPVKLEPIAEQSVTPEENI